MGVNGKFYRSIKQMYSNTCTRVKLPGGLTEAFETNKGIRQGDSLSPLLFCLYIDDIRDLFDVSCAPCSIYTILYKEM